MGYINDFNWFALDIIALHFVEFTKCVVLILTLLDIYLFSPDVHRTPNIYYVCVTLICYFI